jgi:hypothetical protein
LRDVYEIVGLWQPGHGIMMRGKLPGVFMARRFVFALALMAGLTGISQAQVDEMQARTACQDDAFRLCQATIPDRERTLACLIQNKEGLSGSCRTVLAEFFPPEPKKSARQRAKRGSGPVDLSPSANR